jgi:hypothetical protein
MISSRAKPRRFGLWRLIIGLFILLLLGGLGVWLLTRPGKLPEKPLTKTAAALTRPVETPGQNVIDYNKLMSKEDESLTAMMNKRKADYGLTNSLDMVVKSGETIRVGEQTVPMKKIIDQIHLKLHEIVETDLTGQDPVEEGTFGVYVARPKDNIWNVHFNLLKEYFKHKNIVLSPNADEPNNMGYSSGVGKILKFSEKLVHIYNLKTDQIDTNLSVLDPLQKVVIYKMDVIFDLLDQLDYKRVDRLEFDGETLWIPQETGQ